ncbi:hypothetical protein P8A18_19940 [Streptomyces castrisilvae]|uniref:PqqD family protein n=1 Tax=Streptomyces castrisilvae TaxID=3033811 RepID=A0ABY9HND4_9ACTN|nr:hypothetical protein [Streptomyces sp. Mut1]WLQ35547.1 hypothetical protein P8A18_19940 [Streptomyces sp. Mut1]
MLDLKKGQWRMFSGAGERIWLAIALYGVTTGLAEELAVPAGLDVAAARRAVDSYVTHLIDTGLLAPPGQEPHTPRWTVRRRHR